MEDLHKLYPEALPDIPISKMKGSPVDKKVAYFCEALKYIRDSWMVRFRYDKTDNMESINAEQLVFATLDYMIKAARDLLDMLEDEDLKNHYRAQSSAFKQTYPNKLFSPPVTTDSCIEPRESANISKYPSYPQYPGDQDTRKLSSLKQENEITEVPNPESKDLSNEGKTSSMNENSSKKVDDKTNETAIPKPSPPLSVTQSKRSVSNPNVLAIEEATAPQLPPAAIPSKGSAPNVVALKTGPVPPPPPAMPSKGSVPNIMPLKRVASPPPPPPLPSKGSAPNAMPLKKGSVPPPPPLIPSGDPALSLPQRMPSKSNVPQPPPPPAIPSKGLARNATPLKNGPVPPPPPPMPSRGPAPPPPPLMPSKGPVPPLLPPMPSRGPAPHPLPLMPSKGPVPSPPPQRKGPSPPPPSSLGPGKSMFQKRVTNKLRRSTQMPSLFRDLKGKMEGSTLVKSTNIKKVQLGGSKGGKEGLAASMAELAKRSTYFQEIEKDIQKFAKPIVELKVAINSFQTKDMIQLLKFQSYVESILGVLTDESQVLAKFEDFPTKKLETLRTAAALYSKFDTVVTTLKNWEIVPPLGQVLIKIENYLTKIKLELDAFDRSRDEESKKFKSHNIDFDFHIAIKIKESMVDVSSSCMEVALQERKEAKTAKGNGSKTDQKKKESIKMLWRVFQLAFRVYSFAGGQDDRAEKLAKELADEILIDSPNQ